MDEVLMDIADFSKLKEQYPNFKVVGQCDVVSQEENERDLAKNLYELSKLCEAVDNVDALVPCYLKDVEAKKICL